MDNKTIIEIFYFNAGGGHTNAMNALKDLLAEQHPDWIVKPVDLQKLLEPVDPVHRITGKISPHLQTIFGQMTRNIDFRPLQAQDIYNAALKQGRTRGSGRMLAVLQKYIKSYAPEMEALLRRRWQDPTVEKPSLVVSVVPNFNAVMYHALTDIYPDVPYLTIMTDMVDYPPNFWMENQDQFMVCGTDKAFDQAVATGFYAPEKILRVPGMIIKQCFYNQPEQPRLTHAELGLSPDRPTVLIMFGGNGSVVSRKIVEKMEKAKLGVQTIVMCGKNAKLYDSLQGKAHCHPVGFVANVADYMRLADIFIGKPGPGSISEALHMGCPIIVDANKATMPQERPNVDWILEKDVGIAVKSFRTGTTGAVQRIIADIDKYRRNIKTNIPENRAIYQIADILNDIVSAQPLSSRDEIPLQKQARQVL